MFNSAQQDQNLLSCLDWLDQVGTVDVDLRGIAANDAADIRAMLADAAEEKLDLMLAIAGADIRHIDPRVWAMTTKTYSNGTQSTTVRMRYSKSQVLGKLLRLMSCSKPRQPLCRLMIS
jgi:hypothetical protein